MMKSEGRRPVSRSASFSESDLHAIRLRGPWQFEVVDRFGGPSAAEKNLEKYPRSGQIRVPTDWGSTLGQNFTGRVCFSRRFHCPTGLGDRDRVALVVEQVDAAGTCSLNGHNLGSVSLTQALRVDVTDLLGRQNLLKIEVECPARDADGSLLPRGIREQLPGGLIGPVRLEIDACE